MEQGGKWCILRTAGAGTLGVASSLDDAGYETWTPKGMATKRVGRERRRVDQVTALMPTFVFARYDRLADLVEMSRSPAQTYQVWDKDQRRMVTRGCPFFRVFRHGTLYPAVTERELDRLRIAERRNQSVKVVRIMERGERVRYPNSGFDGLVGVVEEVKGSYAFVTFEGFDFEIKVGVRSLLSAA